jgi:hypothetical protein
MARHAKRKFDIYRGICPVASATIMLSGVVILAMGDMIGGGAFIFSGMIVGSMAPMKTKKIYHHRHDQH